MAQHWRVEACETCGAERERTWIVREIPKGLSVSPGFKVEHYGATWKRVARATPTVTLCLCDAEC